MKELHGLQPASATRPRRRFQSYSIDIMAYRLAVIEQLGALTVVEGKLKWSPSQRVSSGTLIIHG